MKMVSFRAKGVAATELPDLNSQVVVLAADPDEDGGPRLEISRALAYTKQDRELGQDTYALSTQTGATVYGGVRSYAVDGSTLTIWLDPRAQGTLGVPERVSIVLDADAAVVETVRLALISILGAASGNS